MCFWTKSCDARMNAAEAAALPVDMLGGRIDDAVGAERERALIDRRGEHIVDNERCAGFVRDLRDRGDVDHLERRIGRRLQKKRFGIRPHRVAPLVEIGAVDQRRGDAVARQIILDDIAARAEQRLRRHHVVAGFELADERQRHGGHAGRGRARSFGAFERRHALFEHRDRRIGKARILEARLFVLEAALGLGGAIVDVAWVRNSASEVSPNWRAQRAGMHQTGLGAVTIRLWTRSCGPPHWPNKNPAGRIDPRAGLTRPRPFSNLFYVAASRPAQMTTG